MQYFINVKEKPRLKKENNNVSIFYEKGKVKKESIYDVNRKNRNNNVSIFYEKGKEWI